MTINKELQAKIDRFFSEFGPRPDFKVAIYRVEPKWCAGYIETVDVFEPNDVTLDDIRDSHGGGKFHLKIMDARCRYIENRTITISGEPLQHGRSIGRTR